ncbi:MAG: ABC transporter ATP-binding protein [Dehalococcoidia bacterium]
MGELLTVRGVSSGYGQIRVLRSISLNVLDGEIVALLGANGAGKTTTLNTISGLVKLSSGELLFAGKSVARQPAEMLPGLGLVQVPEGRQIFGSMSVEDNLLLGGYHRYVGNSRSVRGDVREMFEMFPVLGQRRRQLAQSLSGGEQQMLALARGLMARPRLLLLDEPSLGLAPMVVSQVFAHIGSLPERGVTVLLVEQNAKQALEVANRGYVLENGSIVMSGKASQLLKDERVRSAYLGDDNPAGPGEA